MTREAMTRTGKFSAWAALLTFALALRIGLALGSPNIFFPDEIFQTLEPAHRLVYGYGVISWEWRLGIRSWVFPAFLAGIMRATAWMGHYASGYLVGTIVVLSLLSLTTVWFGYAWARRASGTPAAVIAALACSFYFGLVYFAPKTLNEVVAAHVMLPGLYLGRYGDGIGERKRLFLAGIFLGLAACLRIQLLPAILFALIYFCCRSWRTRTPAVAAGAALPFLVFGAVDWITWSYPWQSFLRYFQQNVIEGPGKELTLPQPWFWYVGVLLVLLGPAILFIFHGARRSPFLAIFCVIIVVSHSLIRHKEIRFIYPILAPAITMAAMGAVDLLNEIKQGIKFLNSSKWIVAISTVFFLLSSVLLATRCADWYRTRWGIGAFVRLSHESGLCGVGICHQIWWQSGGYTYLHRDVPIIPVQSESQLLHDVPSMNALIAPADSSGIPREFTPLQCWEGVCIFERPGACVAPPANEELNAYLKSVGL